MWTDLTSIIGAVIDAAGCCERQYGWQKASLNIDGVNMPNILILRKTPPKAQQGNTLILALLIILLIPYIWLGLGIGQIYWSQLATQRAVHTLATDSTFLTLARGASDKTVFLELSRALSMRDVIVTEKDFSIDHSTTPPVMQVHIHQEVSLFGELKIVLDDLIKEQLQQP